MMQVFGGKKKIYLKKIVKAASISQRKLHNLFCVSIFTDNKC